MTRKESVNQVAWLKKGWIFILAFFLGMSDFHSFVKRKCHAEGVQNARAEHASTSTSDMSTLNIAHHAQIRRLECSYLPKIRKFASENMRSLSRGYVTAHVTAIIPISEQTKNSPFSVSKLSKSLLEASSRYTLLFHPTTVLMI